jgi:formylglycine-generating enzyme required for sulfatase activity
LTNEDRPESNEGVTHKGRFNQAFAVSKFEVTFEQWDACYELGGCPISPGDQDWGRGEQPVIIVSWDEAQSYVTWLSQMTGHTYRLLSEAEWEYAARSNRGGAYSWGDSLGQNNANCQSCGSRWDGKRTAPVGMFRQNAFGLCDMHGNVWEWVQDCWHPNYKGAPTDGSPWITSGDCRRRMTRGGSWYSGAQGLRSTNRNDLSAVYRVDGVGFRVARTLNLESGGAPNLEATSAMHGAAEFPLCRKEADAPRPPH